MYRQLLVSSWFGLSLLNLEVVSLTRSQWTWTSTVADWSSKGELPQLSSVKKNIRTKFRLKKNRIALHSRFIPSSDCIISGFEYAKIKTFRIKQTYIGLFTEHENDTKRMPTMINGLK